MGRELVDFLRSQSIAVYTVNRGKRYWGEKRETSIVADRKNRQEYREKIEKFIQRTNTTWLGIVDFCAYKPKDITESLPDCLFDSDLFPIYILISTDSVYEAIPEQLNGISTMSESITDKYPNSMLDKTFDSYGYKKLLCERALLERSRSNVVCLRLPDVIGEFDDTHRFWCYKLWVQSGLPVHASSDDIPLAFVYSRDVVSVIAKLLLPNTGKEVIRDCINIGCSEQVSLRKLIEMISEAVGENTADRRFEIGFEKYSFFPSVERRIIPLNFDKAVSLLGWSPTPLREAIQRTVEWLNRAEELYPESYKDALESLPAEIQFKFR
jgi:nucleoside-diphosphate-sugar epimerase